MSTKSTSAKSVKPKSATPAASAKSKRVVAPKGGPAGGRASELEKLLARYSQAYYAGNPEVADDVFDSLTEELRSLKPTSKVLDTIGESDFGDAGLVKVPHEMSMHSQAKARSLKEFETWFKRLPLADRSGEFVLQDKLDGLSLELVYRKGKLTHAITQGKEDGYDIIANIRGCPGVPLKLSTPADVSVRGELIMRIETFQTKYLPLGYKAIRNTAVGLAKKKGKAADLRVVCYEVYFPDLDPPTEVEAHEWLTDEGFEVCQTRVVGGDEVISTVEALHQSLNDARLSIEAGGGRELEDGSTLEYEIDGIVIKAVNTLAEDIARDAPKRQIALKFPPRGAISVLRRVDWQVSGLTYTPVGIFNPIVILDHTVSRANLCNPSIINELGVKIGSEIYVTKRGDIIPKIESVVSTPEGSLDIEVPEECLACQSPLEGREGKRLWCPNEDCPNRLTHLIQHWINVLDVNFFGGKLIAAMTMRGLVTSIADLYEVDVEDVAQLNLAGLVDEETGLYLAVPAKTSVTRKVGLKTATKALANLAKASESVELAKFLGGFDIPTIGTKIFGLVFDHIPVTNLEDIFDLDRDSLLEIHGMGNARADAILYGLKTKRDQILAVAAHVGVVLPVLPEEGQEVEPKGSVCFTGKMSLPRAELEGMARRAGFEVKTGVSAKLTYLVTNDAHSGSAKNNNARAKGIQVIDEETFREML